MSKGDEAVDDAFPWSWEERDFYQLLEIRRDASVEDIKRAYRFQQMVWHPDRAPGSMRPRMTIRNQAIKRAYDELSDPVKRKRFDMLQMPEPTEVDAFPDGPQRNPQIWKRMAAWMKDEDVGTSFHRRMAFQAGDCLERRRQPSEKQLKYMREAWEAASLAGFDPKRALNDE